MQYLERIGLQINLSVYGIYYAFPSQVETFIVVKRGMPDLRPYYKYLIGLKKIDVSMNVIKEIPSEVAKAWTKLEEARFQDNRLEFLPREISYWENLRILDVSKNQLYALPPEIGELMKLELLDISENAIEELPSCLKNLLHLREINAIDNKIFKMEEPIFIRMLSGGVHIYMDHNPIVENKRVRWTCF